MNKYFSVTVSILAILLTASVASAQNKGVITGKVVTDDGSPVANSKVYINRVGSSGKARDNSDRGISAETDDDGNFKAEGLSPRLYSIFVGQTKDYVQQPIPSYETDTANYFKVGDNVTLRLVKGGVITGRVTNTENEPAVAMPVSAIMVKDSFGNAVPPSQRGNRITDDRGIYRLYGLSPGTYVVYTSSTNEFSRPRSLDAQPPTYYPSSTRDTATQVTIVSGGEVSGIDIQFRSSMGYAVTGTVTGIGETTTRAYQNIGINIRNIATNFIQGSSLMAGEAGYTFGFYGISDGEYEISTAHYSGDDNSLRSIATKIITIKGGDVTGVNLKLIRGASIDGRMVIEKSGIECKPPIQFTIEEQLFRITSMATSNLSNYTTVRSNHFSAESNGDFTINDLKFETYNFNSVVLADNLYLKSMTVPGKTPRSFIDVSEIGISLKQGEIASKLAITLSDDAASLHGKITTAKEGGELPARLRIYLVPNDKAHTDNVLRYSYTVMRNDSTFMFRNVAPGKYWIIATPIPEDEPANKSAFHTIRNVTERAKLRKEAEEKKLEIELKSCSKTIDYKLSY